MEIYRNKNRHQSTRRLVIYEILPFIHRMIEKEKQHLEWLKKNNAPSSFISSTIASLQHLKQREIEYVKYIHPFVYVSPVHEKIRKLKKYKKYYVIKARLVVKYLRLKRKVKNQIESWLK